MKKSFFSTISLLIALIMILGVFASCTGNTPITSETGTNSATQGTEVESDTEPGAESDSKSETKSETNSESASESSSDKDEETNGETDTKAPDKETDPGDDKPIVEADGKHSALINLNNSKANTVQAYFTNHKRTHYNLTNTEMTMSYARATTNQQLVAYIANTKGNKYIENTMDVFITMAGDGSTTNTFYASDSSKEL